MHCKDGSDEEDCHPVVTNKGYNRLHTPPPLPGDKHFFLNVSFDFRQILYIDEVEHFFRITYNLKKDWYDSSLTFQNLKRDKVNLISKDNRDMIWDPWIHSKNIENAEKEKRTGEAEIYQVVPNGEFHFKNSSKTDIHNAFLFEVLISIQIKWMVHKKNKHFEPVLVCCGFFFRHTVM